jgi:hypothetical protein
MSQRQNYNVGLLRVPPIAAKYRAPRQERTSSSSESKERNKKGIKIIDSFLRESQMQWRAGDKYTDTAQTFAELA